MPDDTVAVYVGGRGEVLDDIHEQLDLTSDTDPADVADALSTAELAHENFHDAGAAGAADAGHLLLLPRRQQLTAAAITSMPYG